MQLGKRRRAGLREFRVAGLGLLDAFDIRVQHVRRLDQAALPLVAAVKQAAVDFGHLVRQHGEKRLFRLRLHLGERGAQGAGKIFDRRRHIPRDGLLRIVVQRDRREPVRVDAAAEIEVVDNAERMREHGDRLGVLLEVFLRGVAHEAPAVDVFHSGNKGEKFTAHMPRPPAAGAPACDSDISIIPVTAPV